MHVSPRSSLELDLAFHLELSAARMETRPGQLKRLHPAQEAQSPRGREHPFMSWPPGEHTGVGRGAAHCPRGAMGTQNTQTE